MESENGTCSVQLHGIYSKSVYHSISSKAVCTGNLFSNGPKIGIAVAINTNSAVVGSFHESPFNYDYF